jgi:hypothetical protein
MPKTMPSTAPKGHCSAQNSTTPDGLKANKTDETRNLPHRGLIIRNLQGLRVHDSCPPDKGNRLFRCFYRH